MFESMKFSRVFGIFHPVERKHIQPKSEIYINLESIIAIEPGGNGTRPFLDQYVWEVEEDIEKVKEIMFAEEK